MGQPWHDAAVASIMVRQPTIVGMDEPLWRVRELMRRHRFQHVLVSDEAGRLVGVVSDRDVLGALSPVVDNPRVARTIDLATLEKRVHQVMGRGLLAAAPTATVAEVARLMLEHGIHCVPVVEDEACVGIVTTSDVVRALLGDEPAAAHAA